MLDNTSIDPSNWYHQMREENPIYYDPDFTFFFGAKGAWHIFRHEDVRAVANDPETFSNEYMTRSTENLFSIGLAGSDPPHHKTLRTFGNHFFSPSAISNTKEWMYDLCEEMLRPWLQHGKMDFITDFAAIMPTIVIAKLLGISTEYHEQVVKWVDTFVGDPAIIGIEAHSKANQEMRAFLLEQVEERRKAPGSDFITGLLQAEVDGEKLSETDLLAYYFIVLIGGSETIVNLLGNAMFTFTEIPELQAHLIRYPEDIPKAINEVLRYRSPAASIPRRAKRDILFQGHQIKEGDMVNLSLGAANRDPSVFSDPDTFDINRDNSRILSFGHGIHYCMGAAMAKLEARIFFEVIFKYLREIHLQPGAALSRKPSGLVYGLKSLPIRFHTHEAL
ncbi:cytochrome P450 [Chitinophaga sp. SYP-B3965]|uniref:cytochrome P450 n=1 Tax=Chitinophaga sp. SYP-B3965 TaxID=2663120 RepID=UPI001299C6E7|nr:cytochrome P450 [Chitinophaga sp. SYP-B3965]MRG44775.1 cytochrome P450 [Chitinophaga sp. SYP-B3965]